MGSALDHFDVTDTLSEPLNRKAIVKDVLAEIKCCSRLNGEAFIRVKQLALAIDLSPKQVVEVEGSYGVRKVTVDKDQLTVIDEDYWCRGVMRPSIWWEGAYDHQTTLIITPRVSIWVDIRKLRLHDDVYVRRYSRRRRPRFAP